MQQFVDITTRVVDDLKDERKICCGYNIEKYWEANHLTLIKDDKLAKIEEKSGN